MNTGKSIQTPDGLEIVYSPVTVDAILTPADSLQHGVETRQHRAQLRQLVTTKYPKSRGNALFPSSAFGAPQSFEEKRVTWLNVPEGTSVETIQARLEELPCPTLSRILDLKPILTESQLTAMEKGINTKTIEEYKQDFVRRSENDEPVLFKNHYQYRAIQFGDDFIEDIDNRALTLAEIIRSQGAVQMAQPMSEEAANAVAQTASAGRF
jgi:hypothetical protein